MAIMQHQSKFQQAIFYENQKVDSKIYRENKVRSLDKTILRNSTNLEDSYYWIQDLCKAILRVVTALEYTNRSKWNIRHC